MKETCESSAYESTAPEGLDRRPKRDARGRLFMQIHKVIGVPFGDGVTGGKATPLLDHQQPSKTVMRSVRTH